MWYLITFVIGFVAGAIVGWVYKARAVTKIRDLADVVTK